MTGRTTRAAVAKGAISPTPPKEAHKPQLPSPPATSVPPKAKPKAKPKKTKLAASKEQGRKEKVNQEALPTPSSSNDPSPPPHQSPASLIQDPVDDTLVLPKHSVKSDAKKRKREVKDEDDESTAMPHNIGAAPEAKEEEEDSEFEARNRSTKEKSSKKLKSRTQVKSSTQTSKDQKDADRSVMQLEKVKAKYAEDAARREKAIESGKKTKSETYGLSEGQTPFPRWQHPTPEECQEVHDILSKHHPECKPQPKTVPEPSKFVAGCGEVRSILDALIRTRLSASTTGRNSSTAYQGMIKRYGTISSGVGKGGVDYKAVRKAPVQDLFFAIKGGGLAVHKSADIMAILDIVYDEMQTRRNKLVDAKKTKNKAKAPAGGDVENDEQATVEIKLAEEENLSLDHYYTLPTYDAIYKFMTLPGIGVKTAACVAMFCMQRPCFAVDTHVFRLAKWLGWVPPQEEKQKGDKTVDRDTTFSHLEVKVPDRLKYMLHQLLIKHGKTCPRCRGNTGEGSSGWAEGCVIDHLVQRTGARKGGGDSPAKTKSTPQKKGRLRAADTDDDDDDDEDVEMPDLDDDDETTASSGGEAASEDEYVGPKKRTPAKKPRTRAPPLADVDHKTAKSSQPKPAIKKARKPRGMPVNGWRGGHQVSSSREGSSDN